MFYEFPKTFMSPHIRYTPSYSTPTRCQRNKNKNWTLLEPTFLSEVRQTISRPGPSGTCQKTKLEPLTRRIGKAPGSSLPLSFVRQQAEKFSKPTPVEAHTWTPSERSSSCLFERESDPPYMNALTHLH
jgi:hypothetical protein